MLSNFDNEMKRLQAISNIEKTLKITGTDPMSLMYVSNKRSFLDRMKIPKKIRLKNCCCRMKMSYYCCLFIFWIIDTSVLIKYFIMFGENIVWSDDYPYLVTLDVAFKAIL